MEAKYNEKQISIINAAEELFAEAGFDGASVRDIAGKANVNVAMISYYFGSKEKLLQAIFEYRIGATTLQLEHLIARQDIDLLKKLDIMIDHYVEKHYHNRCFFKVMQAAHVGGHLSPELDEIVFQSKLKNYQLFGELIGEGQKQNLFRKNIDVSLLVSTLVGSTNQIMQTQNNYRRYHGMVEMENERFALLLKRRTKIFLRNAFKAILTYGV
ncbi:TetR/AcrR family transcriptional regulator [Rurimicrobium arvi]|uniref:TetR family transcriptional regulator n=1 Tax=Rurimicrobium arvi TaxID=2049916 RepID=A0ABP8MUJ6_9BACT